MMMFKMAPALIAGNTLVVKTSEKAPLTGLYIARLARDAGFPAGVLNVLSGFGVPCGAVIASHMKIRKISFTGSVRVGKAIKEAATKSNLKKVTLELGGKSPLIVFQDANLAKAAEAAAKSILLNSGQACIASSRIYVHKSVVKEFCKRFCNYLKELGENPPTGNDPQAPTTRRGPQATKTQFESILTYIKEAEQAGYTIMAGGKRERKKGFFIEPTVIYEPDEQSRVMREEVFGPVVCVSSFEDESDVVRRGNDSEYGLYASVYTRDISRALRIARAFESGTVGVNCTSPVMTHDMPFGGYKQSGEGRELGKTAVDEWTQLKTVYISL